MNRCCVSSHLSGRHAALALHPSQSQNKSIHWFRIETKTLSIFTFALAFLMFRTMTCVMFFYHIWFEIDDILIKARIKYWSDPSFEAYVYLSVTLSNPLQKPRWKTAIRRTDPFPTPRSSATGARIWTPRAAGSPSRCSSTTVTTATSVTACPWTEPYPTTDLRGEIS